MQRLRRKRKEYTGDFGRLLARFFKSRIAENWLIEYHYSTGAGLADDVRVGKRIIANRTLKTLTAFSGRFVCVNRLKVHLRTVENEGRDSEAGRSH